MREPTRDERRLYDGLKQDFLDTSGHSIRKGDPGDSSEAVNNNWMILLQLKGHLQCFDVRD